MMSEKCKSGIIPFSLLLICLFIYACEKPADKLYGAWEMTSYRINSAEETKDQQIKWQFSGEGEFKQIIIVAGRSEERTARWKVNEEKTQLIITYPDNPQPVKWNIIQLDETTLRLEYTIPGFFVEREFKKDAE